jgi:undecaprenyl-diphosphatase
VIELDERVFRYLHDTFGSPGWVVVMSTLTILGSGWGASLVVPLLVRPTTRRFGTSLTVVLVVTAVVVFSLKHIARRKRPYLALEGVRALVFEAPTDYSFPSGHAAGSFAFASFVAYALLRSRVTGGGAWRWILALVMAVLAAAIGLSRIVLGVHFPGDVLAGATIGTCAGVIGAHIHLSRARAAVLR